MLNIIFIIQIIIASGKPAHFKLISTEGLNVAFDSQKRSWIRTRYINLNHACNK